MCVSLVQSRGLLLARVATLREGLQMLDLLLTLACLHREAVAVGVDAPLLHPALSDWVPRWLLLLLLQVKPS